MQDVVEEEQARERATGQYPKGAGPGAVAIYAQAAAELLCELKVSTPETVVQKVRQVKTGQIFAFSLLKSTLAPKKYTTNGRN